MVKPIFIKYKKYIAQFLFIICIVLAFMSIKNIMDYRIIFAEEQSKNIEINIIPNYISHLEKEFNVSNNIITNPTATDSITPKNNMAEFPLWYKGLWEVVNIVLYLFVGGLIYARNNGFD